MDIRISRSSLSYVYNNRFPVLYVCIIYRTTSPTPLQWPTDIFIIAIHFFLFLPLRSARSSPIKIASYPIKLPDWSKRFPPFLWAINLWDPWLFFFPHNDQQFAQQITFIFVFESTFFFLFWDSWKVYGRLCGSNWKWWILYYLINKHYHDEQAHSVKLDCSYVFSPDFLVDWVILTWSYFR